MRPLSIFFALTFLLTMTACTSTETIFEFRPPVDGKAVGENWPAILQQAQLCQHPECGSASYKLFRVAYPQFSLVFVGPRKDDFDPFDAHFNVFRERNGQLSNYHLTVSFGDETSYLTDTEFVHSTENIELSPEDNTIAVVDTGLVVPSRQR